MRTCIGSYRLLVASMFLTLATLTGCADSGSDPAKDSAATENRETLTTATETDSQDRVGSPGADLANANGKTPNAAADIGATGKPAPTGETRTSAPSANPRPVEQKTGGPSIHFFHLEHDFGELYEGDTVTTRFEFVNAGDKPLVVSRVKTSCGCTVAAEPEGEIAPGEKESIEVSFNSSKRAGKQTKDVSVFSNDPEQPMLKLRIEGTVVKQFWVEPERLFLGNLTKSATVEEKKVKVLWDAELDVEVTGIRPSHEQIQVSQKPLEGENGVELTLSFGELATLATRTNNASPRINHTIEIETNNEKFQGRVFVSGALIPEVHVRPGVLSFGVVGRGSKPITKRVIVTGAKDFELAPPTVESDLDYLTFEVKSIRAGTQYQIEATLNPVTAPEGQFRETVIVKTNSEDYAENRIPVFGKIRE